MKNLIIGIAIVFATAGFTPKVAPNVPHPASSSPRSHVQDDAVAAATAASWLEILQHPADTTSSKPGSRPPARTSVAAACTVAGQDCVLACLKGCRAEPGECFGFCVAVCCGNAL
jgi:hypothetical protein